MWHGFGHCQNIVYVSQEGGMCMGDELGVRKFVHAKLVALDIYYKRIESIHMNETTGLIHVKWIGREDVQRENYFQYRRKV